MLKIHILTLSIFLALISCNKRTNIDNPKNFSANVILSDSIISGKKSVLNITLSSNTYGDNILEHEAFFSDDKKSFLISPKGDTIKAGEKFFIPHLDEQSVFNFYTEEIGEHNLNFTFKNSKGNITKVKRKILVTVGIFKFILTSKSVITTINTPIDIVYKYEIPDELKHSYEVMFEVEDTKLDATINGHKAGEWFTIPGHEGNLSFIAVNEGKFTIKIISKNELSVDNTAIFIAHVVKDFEDIENSADKSPIINFFHIDKIPFIWAGEIQEYYVGDFNYELNGYCGTDNVSISNIDLELSWCCGHWRPGIKIKLPINHLKDSPMFFSKGLYSTRSRRVSRPDSEEDVFYKIIVTNSLGLTTTYMGTTKTK